MKNTTAAMEEFYAFKRKIILLIIGGIVFLLLSAVLYFTKTVESFYSLLFLGLLSTLGLWLFSFFCMLALWPFMYSKPYKSLFIIIFSSLVYFCLTSIILNNGRISLDYLTIIYSSLYFIFFCIIHLYKPTKNKKRYALIPLGIGEELLNCNGTIEWTVLKEPSAVDEIDAIVVDLHYSLSEEWLKFIAEQAVRGTPILHAVYLYEYYNGRIPVDYVKEDVFLPLTVRKGIYPFIKRLADIIITLIVSPILIPLSALTSIVVLMDAGRPVLFIQERVGEKERLFKMVKFRTMKNSDKKPSFTSSNDNRITKTGNFLRKVRLDEIPQFWNVLKGEMSIIGPRPEQLPFVKEFKDKIPFYSYRHHVAPGITGWAQVQHGYAASLEDTRIKLEHDLFYIKNRSMFLDLYILFLTVRTIFTGFGAR